MPHFKTPWFLRSSNPEKISEVISMTFKRWLLQFKNEDTPIGDLASDVARDRSLPVTNSYTAWHDHLLGRRACPEALEALRWAWQQYESEVKAA